MDCVPINSMIINKELREGDRQTVGIGEVGDPLPTIQAKQHHAVAIGGVSVMPNCANTITRREDGSPNPDKKQGANVVVVSLDPLGSNSMKSANPNSGSHITEVAKCVDTTNPDPAKNQGGMVICLTPWDCESKRVYDPKGATPTLPSGTKEGANIQPAVLCYPLDMDKLKPSNNTEEAFMRGERKGGNGFGVGSADDPAYTVNTVDRHAVAVAYGITEGAHGVTLQPEAVVTAQGQGGKPGQGYQAVVEKSRAYGIVEGGYTTTLQKETLNSLQVGGGHPGQGNPAVAVVGLDCFNLALTGDVSMTATCAASDPKHVPCVIFVPCIVRRLLPVETERLMGFKDNHTTPKFTPERIEELIPFFIDKFAEWDVINGKDPAKVKRKTPAQIAKWLGQMGTPDQPDAPRYKACGNAFCTNCMEWLGRRLDAVVREDAQEVAS